MPIKGTPSIVSSIEIIVYFGDVNVQYVSDFFPEPELWQTFSTDSVNEWKMITFAQDINTSIV